MRRGRSEARFVAFTAIWAVTAAYVIARLGEVPRALDRPVATLVAPQVEVAATRGDRFGQGLEARLEDGR